MSETRIIQNRSLHGSIASMPSKSVSHRLAIGAALAGNSRIMNIGLSQDIHVTLDALNNLGYRNLSLDGDILQSREPIRTKGSRIVYCRESGSTLRFLIPLGMDGIQTVFTGEERLLARPIKPYADLCAANGIYWEQTSENITVQGQLTGGHYQLPGNISSQFVSGLLFALPTCQCDSVISLSNPIESKGYIDLTLQVMRNFGIDACWQGDSIHIPQNQTWKPFHGSVEGDYSHAAFFLTAGVLGKGVNVRGLLENSLQGDRQIIDILRGMGAHIERLADGYQAYPSVLQGATIDARQIPDLVPILAVAACAALGETRIINAGRLRMKESDRLSAMYEELSNIGADIQQIEDGLLIRGGKMLRGGTCNSHKDHRIAMSLAIASVLCGQPIILSGADNVCKSAPQFWEELELLGECSSIVVST